MDNTKGRKKKTIGEDYPFAVRLSQLLKETKTTLPTIAEAIGVSRQAVGLWKLGKTVPDLMDFIKVADYFGVSLEYMAGRTEQKIYTKDQIEQRAMALDEALNILSREIEIIKKGEVYNIAPNTNPKEFFEALDKNKGGK